MYAIFNELSIQPPFETHQIANDSIRQLLKTFGDAKEIGFTKIEFERIDNICLVNPEYTVLDWLNDNTVNRTLKQALLSVQKSPYSDDSEDAYLSESVFKHEKTEVIGLKIAFARKLLAISFYGEDRPLWDTHSLTIYDEVLNPYTVRHASLPVHISYHKLFFQRLNANLATWHPELDSLFSVTGTEKTNVWDTATVPSDRKEMIATTRTMARQVATNNGWKYDTRISNNNSSSEKIRDIYRAGDGKQTMFLSVDVEKYGCFEVCDFRGEHLGEFNFSGKRTQDATAGHNIKI